MTYIGARAKFNFTGKKFMCISTKEDEDSITMWSIGFKTGEIYSEAIIDSHGYNLIEKEDDNDIVLLIDEYGDTIYCDKNNFVESISGNKILSNMWIYLN